MENQNSSNKTTLTIIIVVVILFLLLMIFLAGKDSRPNGSGPVDYVNGEAPVIVLENTPTVNGRLPAPEGLPASLPVEIDSIIESATTRYPEQGALQLSLSYASSKTVADKYAEYKNYMADAGYDITESDAKATPRAIFGVSSEANLSVVISTQEGRTLVQLSYLKKSL